MKILCIVAHPDDEALGPGGTLIKHSLNGEEVNVFIFSDGEGAKKDIKKNSKRLLQQINGVKKLMLKYIKLLITQIKDLIHCLK